MNAKRVAVITPTYRQHFEWCSLLNRSVLTFFPPSIKHYLVVDRRDVGLFSTLKNERTVVLALEDIAPGGFFKLPGSKYRWCLRAAVLPVRGWVVQQVSKIAMASVIDEDIMVMVDSDVTFVRSVDPLMFTSPDGKTRLYRRPDGIEPHQANFITWHNNDCRLLNVSPDLPPMDDYVGNMISWDRKLVLQMCARVESVTGKPWHVAFTKSRRVSEYILYGLFVEKVIGSENSVRIDNRAWCHTYWGRTPLEPSALRSFLQEMPDDDVAFSIAGYSGTTEEVRESARRIISERQTAISSGFS